MKWIIKIKNPATPEDAALAWSNEHGWCDDSFDIFTDEERQTFNLPFDGEWQTWGDCHD